MSDQSQAAVTPTAQGTTPTTTTTGAPPAQGDWTSGFNDDLKGYVQTKGFKDPASAIDSYRNLEKLIGHPKERLLTLPENMEDQKALTEIFNRLGRPADKEGYKLQAPEGGDKAFTDWAKNTFHEAGLTAKQAQALYQKYNEHIGGLTKAQTEAYQAEVSKQETALKSEWGSAFEQNVNAAKRAAKEFGIESGVIDQLEKSMGFAGVMKFFANVGSKIGEGDFVGGDGTTSTSGAMTPAMATHKIQALKSDKEFHNKLINKDSAALREWTRLHEMANPQP